MLCFVRYDGFASVLLCSLFILDLQHSKQRERQRQTQASSNKVNLMLQTWNVWSHTVAYLCIQILLKEGHYLTGQRTEVEGPKEAN